MFQVFRNAWKDPALRKKILFTLLIIVIFRFGAAIFVPFLEPSTIKQMMGEGTILNYLDVMTGGSLSNGTLFAMSITPYINASIIVQLLTVAIPALERLSKEGEEGQDHEVCSFGHWVIPGDSILHRTSQHCKRNNTQECCSLYGRL